MKKAVSILQGITIGATLMYLLDPTSGKRRRAAIRDRLPNARLKTKDTVEKAAKTLKGRASGLAAEANAALSGEPISDHELIARIRAQIERAVNDISHITIAAHEGNIILSGTIDPLQIPKIVESVQSTRGVNNIENRLNAH